MSLSSFIILQLMLLWAVFLATAEINLPGCQERCGNVSIPYPFGTTEECCLDSSFLVTCNNTGEGLKPYLDTGSTIEITDLYVHGQMRIWPYQAVDCYDYMGPSYRNNYWINSRNFVISNTLNKFIAVGCDTYAVVRGSLGQKYTTGCLSLCDSMDNVINGSCSGIGCCQSAIPKGATNYNMTLQSYYNHSYVMSFNPCSYAFLVEEGTYNFSSADLLYLPNDRTYPVILEWAIWNQTCSEAKKDQASYACKGNSKCYDSEDGLGYRCDCSEGYEGNPYLVNGCQDVDECNSSHPCNMTCHNLPGTYNCSCGEGYEGDGRKNGTGCRPIPDHKKKIPILNIALGISISISLLLLGGSWMFWWFRQMKIIKLREHFFQQNGGIMLQRQLSKHEGSVQSAKIFTAEELKKATDNYHESMILGRGGQGTVFKGILPDNTTVAIKKSIIGDHSQIEQFINEVIILSQVNHRNVVKILGCCLETEIPLLVYEFVSNGTLYDHLHGRGTEKSSITWENRMRMASETASAFSYLHSAASTPIIHRDVKTTNILLDENYTAKVSDFGASRLVPVDQTQLTTMVQGTLGYLDPEYFQSSQLTEKSDVYSFGVVLVELLTGMKALCFERPQEERSLINYFSSSIKDGRLIEIVDVQVISEANIEQIKQFSVLAKSCLRARGEERPSMKEVSMELERLRMMGKHPWINQNADSEESEYLLGEFSDPAGSGASVSTSYGYDSMQSHVILPFEVGGR